MLNHYKGLYTTNKAKYFHCHHTCLLGGTQMTRLGVSKFLGRMVPIWCTRGIEAARADLCDFYEL